VIEKLIIFSGDPLSPVGAKQRFVRSSASSCSGSKSAAMGLSRNVDKAVAEVERRRQDPIGRPGAPKDLVGIWVHDESVGGFEPQGRSTCPR
jgi:hypothetical protein